MTTNVKKAKRYKLFKIKSLNRYILKIKLLILKKVEKMRFSRKKWMFGKAEKKFARFNRSFIRILLKLVERDFTNCNVTPHLCVIKATEKKVENKN